MQREVIEVKLKISFSYLSLSLMGVSVIAETKLANGLKKNIRCYHLYIYRAVAFCETNCLLNKD